MRGRFRWVVDTLSKRMPFFAPAVQATIHEQMSILAEELEASMKREAPWSDRTGEARAGLTAEVISKLTSQEIVLYNTAEHGYWLEVAMAGQYAIIIPTLERVDGFYGPRVTGIIGNSSVGFSVI